MKYFLSVFIFFCSSAIFVSSKSDQNKQIIPLNFTEIADFIETLKQPFLNSIENREKPQELISKVAEDYAAHYQNGIQILLVEILDKVSNANGLIEEKCGKLEDKNHKLDENFDAEEVKLNLTLHELYRLGSKMIKENIHGIYQQNMESKRNVHKWWIRYRYKVNSAVNRSKEPINEIRKSLFQYYFDAYCNFNEIMKQLKEQNECLAKVVEQMPKSVSKYVINAQVSEEEKSEFEPSKEMSQIKLQTLMAHSKNGTPIFVLTERFCRKYGIGHFYQAIGVNHRAVKVYGTEFHFANSFGLFIYDKRRERIDSEKRGIKFTRIGFTKKTQWEVQQIFDKFSAIYEENGQIKEAKFDIEKYSFFDHNCVHFARQFVEALMEGNKDLEDKKWPPKVLRQSYFNQNKFKKLAMCVMGVNDV